MSERAPVLIAVDDEVAALERIEGELQRRYGGDYRVVCERSASAATATLERMRAGGDDVALVLADQWMPGENGSEFLGRIRALYPNAKRALLVEWGAWADRPTTDAILEAIARGRTDYYVLKPVGRRDEYFHRTIAEFLHEWSRERGSGGHELLVVADPCSPRGYEIRELLGRSGISYAFREDDSAVARSLSDELGGEHAGPLLRMHGGKVLVDPSNEEIAAAYGVDTEPTDGGDSDVVIVGAGPAGLSAAVYASSEGLGTLVLEREAVGGQAGSSSLIRNYLGFSRGISGGELSQRAYQQAWVFGTQFAITREAVALAVGDGDGVRHSLSCNAGFTGTAGAVILATGVSYRRIGLPAIDALVGAGVYYGAATTEAQGLSNEDVYVVGGGNSAGQTALHLARSARTVTLLVRGESLAPSMSHYLRDTIEAAPNVAVRTGTEVVDGGGAGQLEWLELRDRASGSVERVGAAALFILIGARPRTEWLPDEIARDDAGYVLAGTELLADERGAGLWPLERMPMTFETSVPGVFAIGDVRRGSLKRVAAAVGEGSVVIRQVHEWFAERRPRAAVVGARDAVEGRR